MNFSFSLHQLDFEQIPALGSFYQFWLPICLDLDQCRDAYVEKKIQLKQLTLQRKLSTENWTGQKSTFGQKFTFKPIHSLDLLPFPFAPLAR